MILAEVVGARALTTCMSMPASRHASAILGGGRAGQRGDEHRLAGALPQRTRDVEAADVGQPEVEHDDIGVERRRALERLLAGHRRERLMAEQAQQQAGGVGGAGIVVDDQDPHRGHETTADRQ